MLTQHILLFCRAVVEILFALASFQKLLHFHRFELAIAELDMLRPPLARAAAGAVLLGEVTVVSLLSASYYWWYFGFGLGAILFLTFTVVLVSALVRRSHVSCNCFGPTAKSISKYDVWRNLGFLGCSASGLVSLAMSSHIDHYEAGTSEVLATVAIAIAFVTISNHLGEITELMIHS